MNEIKVVRRRTDAVMSMIRKDQSSGQVPPDVVSIDELDNYVDIDDYYRRIGLPAGDLDAAELRDAVGEEIGRRLAMAQGGPWHVIGRGSDGVAREIGRTTGYATNLEAQAIGREHVRAHGGGFHLRRD